MKPILVSDENHNRIKVLSAQKRFTITQIMDKLIDKWLDDESDDLGVFDSLDDDHNNSIKSL